MNHGVNAFERSCPYVRVAYIAQHNASAGGFERVQSGLQASAQIVKHGDRGRLMLRAYNAGEDVKAQQLRGMFRKGTSVPVDAIGRFDLIVHPGDAVPHAASEVEHGVEELHVPPMLLIDPEEMWPRDTARRRLGVPQDARVVYVQLGAGRINDIDSDVRRVVDALLAHEDVHVVLGESMLGERLEVDLERVHLVRDYPNALYLKAFDASVQAGGYNSFHEMRSVGLPTLFLPNMNTGMDDQLARCKVAEEEGWGRVRWPKQGTSKLRCRPCSVLTQMQRARDHL